MFVVRTYCDNVLFCVYGEYVVVIEWNRKRYVFVEFVCVYGRRCRDVYNGCDVVFGFDVGDI